MEGAQLSFAYSFTLVRCCSYTIVLQSVLVIFLFGTGVQRIHNTRGKPAARAEQDTPCGTEGN